jgi:hypothetical protein
MFFDFFGREHPIGCSALADQRPSLGISLELTPFLLNMFAWSSPDL